MTTLPRRTFAAALAATAVAPDLAGAAPKLEQIATFDMQVTGVTVSDAGRIFVCFPRWEQDVPISVAELGPGNALVPYPDAGWNAWRNAKPLGNGDHFVCVQSIVAGPNNALWVLDPAAPGNEFNLEGGPKLVAIDLGTNKVTRTILFDREAVPQGSYVNDVRFSPDGKWAYLTDSGVIGALIVVALETGKARRLLSGHPSTQVEKGVKVVIGNKPLVRPDGRGPMFAADGIALDPKGEYLYWQALTGKTLYRIAITALTDPTLAPAKVEAAVETLGTTCIADGYWMDKKGRLLVTSPEDNAVKLRGADGKLATVVHDTRLRWPDTMSEGPDGAFYVTASHIQDMGQWAGNHGERKGKTALFKFRA